MFKSLVRESGSVQNWRITSNYIYSYNFAILKNLKDRSWRLLKLSSYWNTILLDSHAKNIGQRTPQHRFHALLYNLTAIPKVLIWFLFLCKGKTAGNLDSFQHLKNVRWKNFRIYSGLQDDTEYKLFKV